MNIDPSLQVAAAASLEAIINKALQYDPGSRYALARLQGKVLALEFTQPNLTVFLMPAEHGMRVQSAFDGEVTTRIKGSPLALLSLINSKHTNLANTGIEVFGSTGFLIELQSILQAVDIDWEEAVSSIIGDIAGHQVGNGVRGFGAWLSERKQSFNRLLGEFLTEEIRATPSRGELEYFYRQVDDLRLAVDRATANVQQFVANKNSKKTQSPSDKEAG